MKAEEHRRRVLAKIQAAQSLLLDASQLASPIQGHGWADAYTAIGKHYDLTKALWHRVNNLPRPTGHDHDADFSI